MNDSAKAISERVRRLGDQFLVHSFLYYQLGENVISDAAFDQLADELLALHEAHPEVELPHAAALKPALGDEASGFGIRDYPGAIVTDAFKLLYAVTMPGVEFSEFVERRGYRAEIGAENNAELDAEKGAAGG
ncbi:MAG: hypothetical protein V3S64_06460 [bacterium]